MTRRACRGQVHYKGYAGLSQVSQASPKTGMLHPLKHASSVIYLLYIGQKRLYIDDPRLCW